MEHEETMTPDSLPEKAREQLKQKLAMVAVQGGVARGLTRVEIDYLYRAFDRIAALESECKEKDAEIAALTRVATSLTTRATGAKRGGTDAVLGFEVDGRQVVVRGTIKDCEAVRDTLVSMQQDQRTSHHNVEGLASIVGRFVKGDATAMVDAKRVVEKIEANGGLFTHALLRGVLSSVPGHGKEE